MSNASKDLVIRRLLDTGRLIVNPDTGIVLAPKSNWPMKPLGSRTKKGYLRTCIQFEGMQQYVLLHRVVWISAFGVPSDPDAQIDHKNRIKSDNRLSNLESVDHDENMRRAKAAGAFNHVGRRDGLRDSLGRFGKKVAGRILDGRTHDEYPEAK